MRNDRQLEKMLNHEVTARIAEPYRRGWRDALLYAAKICRAEMARFRQEDSQAMQSSFRSRADGASKCGMILRKLARPGVIARLLEEMEKADDA